MGTPKSSQPQPSTSLQDHGSRAMPPQARVSTVSARSTKRPSGLSSSTTNPSNRTSTKKMPPGRASSTSATSSSLFSDPSAGTGPHHDSLSRHVSSSSTIPLPTTLHRSENIDSPPSRPGAHAVNGEMYQRGPPAAAPEELIYEEDEDGVWTAVMPGSSSPTTALISTSLSSAGAIVAEATKVDETIYATETVNVAQEKQREQKKRQRACVFGCLSVVFVIGALVVIFVTFSRQPLLETDAPSTSPTQAPTFSKDGIEEFVETLTSLELLQEVNSTQQKAFDWLINVDRYTGMINPDIVTQRFVLAVLYYSLNGDEWINNRHWLSESLSVCEWESSASSSGVCNDDGLLVELKLDRNRMKGTLPTELAHLGEQLLVFDVGINGITGTLPTELGLLTNLEIFYVPQNNLRGSVPTELGKLLAIRDLYIDSNDLIGSIPEQICDLKNVSLGKLWADCEEVDCPCCGRCCTDQVPCSF